MEKENPSPAATAFRAAKRIPRSVAGNASFSVMVTHVAAGVWLDIHTPKTSSMARMACVLLTKPLRGMYPWFARLFIAGHGPRRSFGPGACQACSPETDTACVFGSNPKAWRLMCRIALLLAARLSVSIHADFIINCEKKNP